MTQAKIYIVFYSTYLHVYQLALAIKQGLEKVNNVQVEIYQIQETLPTEVLEKMHAPPKPDIPLITPDKLQEADGILFGYPTRFGTLPAQLKNFIDSCGQLWAKGAMNGKMLGTFVSTATQHGGQETSTFTFLTTLAHFGMLYVPFGYSSAHLNEDTKVMGGSPWGASILAGKDGLRQASPEELEVGCLQGEQFAKTVSQYVSGRPLENNEPPTVAPATNEVKEVVKEETAQAEASNAATATTATTAGAATSDVKAATRDIGDAEPPNSATFSDKASSLASKGAQSAVKAEVKHEVKELEHKDGEQPNTEEAKAEEPAAPAAQEPVTEATNPDAEPTGTVVAPEEAEAKKEEVAQPESSTAANGGDNIDSTPSKESHSTVKSSGGTIRKLFKRLTLRGKKKTQENEDN